MTNDDIDVYIIACVSLMLCWMILKIAGDLQIAEIVQRLVFVTIA